MPLLIFLFPLAYSPGPGNLFFAALGARYGLRATLRANLGYHVATFAVTFALGLGLLQMLLAAPVIGAILHYAGAAYILWLGFKLAFSGPLDAADPGAVGGADFKDSVLLLVLNPKAYMIIALMFSQFLPMGAGLQAILTITAIFTANNLIAFLVWTALGDRLARRFRDPASAQILNRVAGTCLGLVALWVAFS